MTEHRIGLTDQQRAILDAKLQRAQAAQQRAEELLREFNEAVLLLSGGEPAEYRSEEGVVVVEGDDQVRSQEEKAG